MKNTIYFIKYNLAIISISIFVLIFQACSATLFDDVPANNPEENFEVMWKVLDEKYTFFRLKGINWDGIYEKYRPMVTQNTNEEELFNIMSDMLYELKDGHTNLISPYNFSRNWSWYLDYPPNFNMNLVERFYLGNKYIISGGLSSTVIDSVAYMYYGSFSSPFTEKQLDYLIDKYSGMKGFIIDIRGNKGGYVYLSDLLVSRFADQQRMVAIRQYKMGPGHNDLSDGIGISIQPRGEKQFTKTVVLLTNRECYSAANDFTLKLSQFPHVTVMGDKTGGGGGLPIYYELPNGWRFRFSSTVTYAPDWFNVENGIEPDIKVQMDPDDEQKNIDTIIEAALAYIKANSN